VVKSADKISVIFQDGSRHAARIIGRDKKTDIAVLKIDTAKPLPYVQWGDSEKARVGDWVVAVGNPFGLGGTVTAGIVSARGRDINEGPYDDFLQIDAPINRGNSGGPTFNLAGEVIGVNTAIFSPSGGSVGIGFAIPSEVAKDVVNQLRQKQRVDRGWLGVGIQDLTPAIARSLALDPNDLRGALVAEIIPNSPAAQAGVRQGDVITEVNGHVIRTARDLRRLVAKGPAGLKLDMSIARAGKGQKLAAVVASLPASQGDGTKPNDDDGVKPTEVSALGLQLAPLTSELRQRLRVPKSTSGVVVVDLTDDSPVAAAGIQPGDVIVSVDQQPVKAPDDAARKLQAAASRHQVLLLVARHGDVRFVGLSADEN
jgi:serine protease Do